MLSALATLLAFQCLGGARLRTRHRVAWNRHGPRVQVSEKMGAFTGLGMGLNGVFTAFVVPVLMPLAARWLAG